MVTGWVAAIQTGWLDRGREVADKLRTGIVHVNDQTLNDDDAYAPFGGTGASGNGARFGSPSSWGRVHPVAVADPAPAGPPLPVLIRV